MVASEAALEVYNLSLLSLIYMELTLLLFQRQTMQKLQKTIAKGTVLKAMDNQTEVIQELLLNSLVEGGNVLE